MTEALDKVWRVASPPFAGTTLFAADEVSWAAFSSASLAVLDRLESSYGTEALFRCDDWHCHDGFVTDSRRLTWAELRSALQTPAALSRITSGDFEVYCAVFPESASFVWRLLLPPVEDWPSPEQPVAGFDFSGAEPLLDEIRAIVSASPDICIAAEPSATYFSRRYAG
jgi:hypothetical protein